MYLLSNQLSGNIPSELGNLTNLTQLFLSDNQLTGCVPAALRNVAANDFASLGLPFCSAQNPTPTPTATPAAAAAAAPAGKPSLTVRAAGATSVSVTWTAVAGATGYDLWRYDGAWAEVGAGLTGTSYTDTGLTTGQTYYYAVAAVNARGRGPWSDNKRVTLSNDAGDPTPTPTPTVTPTPRPSGAQTSAASDRAALVALYNAAGGANWTNNTNWLSARPLGEWHGVTTDGNGRVTELNLYRQPVTRNDSARTGQPLQPDISEPLRK